MAIIQDQTPLINGFLFSFASIRLRVGSLVITRFTECNYKQSAKMGSSYGASVQKQGRTRGKLDGSTNVTLVRVEYNRLVAYLANNPTPNSGYFFKPFDIQVEWRENPGDPIFTDKIIGCMIEDEDFKNGNDKSTDPAVVTLGLNIMGIVPGGNVPVADFQPGPGTPGSQSGY